MQQSFDFIIVGAGSAGCVLANRLTESGEYSVLVLEAGGSDRSLFIQMPTALSYPMNNPKYSWDYESEPEPGLDGRQLHCPRGKVLGGSSSINGMVYVRGHACDFDEWESLGAQGWSYHDCLPYFIKAETWMSGADAYRGDQGPLHTCNGNNMALNPLYRAFIQAGVEAGYPESADYNGEQQEGFSPMHMTVKKGVRCSTANAYLKPVLSRPNITLISHALCHRILFSGKQAIGIEYSVKGQMQQAFAKQEVILSAGSIGSPMLLQLSGIGASEHLQSLGIQTLVDLPGVGENLQDHLEVYFQYECLQPISLNSRLGWFSKGLIGAQWLLFKNGLGASNHFESCGFIRSRAGLQWPNIQYHFLPAAMRYDGRAAFAGHGFQMHVGPNKPYSRGRVKIRSTDPAHKPSIVFNYLEDERDRQDWRDAIRLTREIIQQAAMDAYRGAEIQPGPQVQSDDEIDAWVRAHVESAYHPSCTCKIGSDQDPMAVLNAACEVRGVQGLRVVDSSIFPSITNGNLNAPTIMVAEKAADILLNQPPLPRSTAPVSIEAQWQSQQRRN